jgi:hypothetical protein
MKKSNIKKAIRSSMMIYYDKGLTSTANKFLNVLYKKIDKVYNKVPNNKR